MQIAVYQKCVQCFLDHRWQVQSKHDHAVKDNKTMAKSVLKLKSNRYLPKKLWLQRIWPLLHQKMRRHSIWILKIESLKKKERVKIFFLFPS